ncbi:putative diguanylate cyclase YcdT [compost metagenome]
MCHVFVLILMLLAGFAMAGGVDLTDNASGVWLNQRMDLLEDPSGQLGIGDVRQPPIAERFRPAHGRASVGLSPHPWWQRIDVVRAGRSSGSWWLEVDAVNLRDLRIYLPDAQGNYREHLSGEQMAFLAGRDSPYRRPVFRLPDGVGPLRIYARTFDPAGNTFPMRIWSQEGLQEHRIQANLLLGIVYGLIGALLLYNLQLLLYLRDRAYFWYVLTTASALLFSLGMSGHGFEYLWPDNPVPWWLDRITLPALSALCLAAFTQTLLQTRRHVPWAQWLLYLACLFYIAAIGMNAFGFRGPAAQLLVLAVLGNVPLAVGAAVLRWRQGSPQALLYLMGFGMVLGSISAALLRAFGIAQSSPATAYLFPLSVAMASLLFSFALSSRIQELRHDKALAEEQANREKIARLSLLRSARRDLADAVAERTAELTRSNQLLREREAQLHQAAHCDPLTGLPNRRHLVEQAELALDFSHYQGEPLALMLIDLDHFKPINDTHGHDAGDFLLQSIGQRLRQCVRTSDCVARLGGDEFAVLISGTDAEQRAREIASRLLCELARPVQFDKIEMRVTPSIGVALYPSHARQFSQLYKAADQALYKVKGNGRASYALAETGPGLPRGDRIGAPDSSN